MFMCRKKHTSIINEYNRKRMAIKCWRLDHRLMKGPWIRCVRRCEIATWELFFNIQAILLYFWCCCRVRTNKLLLDFCVSIMWLKEICPVLWLRNSARNIFPSKPDNIVKEETQNPCGKPISHPSSRILISDTDDVSRESTQR